MGKQDHERLYHIIGDKICQARKAKRWSQAKLAAKLGLSRVSIVNIEKGRQRPPVHVIWDIAEVLNLEPSQLVPLQSELADGALEVHLDATTVAAIETAASDDPSTRRRLTEFIQLAKTKIDGRAGKTRQS
jgi:transcriptional regulator with XRE-family HTH domain